MLGLGNNFSRGGVLSAGLVNTYSLSFDGTDDLVVIPNDSSIISTSALTVSAWIYADDLDSNLAILGRLNGHKAGNESDIGILANGSVVVQIVVDSTLRTLTSTAGDVSATTWHHVAIQAESGNQKIYVDNTVVATATTSGALGTGVEDIMIGKGYISGWSFFDGNIDEVAIFDAVVSIGDLRDGSKPADLTGMSNLQGWWRFEEGSGTSATDSSDNSNTGTFTSAPAYSTDVPS